jgi:hypothetical protein
VVNLGRGVGGQLLNGHDVAPWRHRQFGCRFLPKSLVRFGPQAVPLPDGWPSFPVRQDHA